MAREEEKRLPALSDALRGRVWQLALIYLTIQIAGLIFFLPHQVAAAGGKVGFVASVVIPRGGSCFCTASPALRSHRRAAQLLQHAGGGGRITVSG
ncbi:hypothetical protein LNQ03_03400 [Klebsiella pneumoniae subsp. pneumoniae]|nr:hypothetical protein [Klebsiella pneumoniae subsp. pneumoniae]